MRLRTFIGAFVTVAAVCAAMAAPAQAQQVTFATLQSTDGSTPFTYVSGPAGGLQISNAALVFQANSSLPATPLVDVVANFTGLANSGTATFAGGFATQALTGGSFTINRTSDNALLLSGTFTGAQLFGIIGSGTAGVIQAGLDNVVYDPSVYFNASGLINPGNLAFNFTSVNPAIAQNGSYIRGFNASGSGTFSATAAPVPEPGEYAVMGMAGLTVMGLMARARRRRLS